MTDWVSTALNFYINSLLGEAHNFQAAGFVCVYRPFPPSSLPPTSLSLENVLGRQTARSWRDEAAFTTLFFHWGKLIPFKRVCYYFRSERLPLVSLGERVCGLGLVLSPGACR